ncbi:hypothetical protein N7524_008851 [Penicillium chrysogenum]|nr:hypothetical protein N7524_008851 [Penicillium chrysogenum]
MPARAHRRAPDPLAGAVNPLPPCRGLSPMAPRGSGLALYAPLPKPPGRWPPSTPDPQPFGELANLCPRPVRAPRASRLALGRPLRAPASPPPHPLHLTRRCGQLPPAAPTGAPRPGAGGEGDRRWRTVTWGPACRGSYREGHPARDPTVTSPAIPAPPTQRDAATLAGPHSLSPGPLGPGRFYTDSPTPFGV